MDERVLRGFFLGEISGRDLAKDVSGSVVHLSSRLSHVHIRDLDQSFRVTRPMAVSLCDAVLSSELQPALLEPIGFALIASDHFEWEEDDLVGEVFHDWAAPQINYPLTLDNVTRFRRWLLNEEPYPPRGPANDRERCMLVTEKKSTRTPKVSAFVDRVKEKIT